MTTYVYECSCLQSWNIDPEDPDAGVPVQQHMADNPSHAVSLHMAGA